jgi:hypothetical protein
MIRLMQTKCRMDPGAYKPKVDRQGKAKEETAFEGWADNIAEQKPYVSMYSGEDGKQVYDVLDKDGQSAYKSGDYDTAVAYLRKNFNTLAGRTESVAEDMGEKIANMAQNMTGWDETSSCHTLTN